MQCLPQETRRMSDAKPWYGRAPSEMVLSKDNAMANTCLSRLEARLLLEHSLEARSPRLLQRKPVSNGLPVDLYSLHQMVLRFGGYRKVSDAKISARPSCFRLPFTLRLVASSNLLLFSSFPSYPRRSRPNSSGSEWPRRWGARLRT